MEAQRYQAQLQQGATLRFSKVRPSVRKAGRAHAHLPTSWASQEARVISREAEKGCAPFILSFIFETLDLAS